MKYFKTVISIHSSPIVIGLSISSGHFDGLIDEVKVWDRELSVAEISALNAAGRP